MIDTKKIRGEFRSASKKLARARRLYIFLSRRKFKTAGNDYFDYMTDRMKESGLYSMSAKHCRMAIIKHMFRIEQPRFAVGSLVYREWLFKNGIDSSSGYFNPIIIEEERPKLIVNSYFKR